MPELPEVETIRRQLAQRIVGKKLGNRTITAARRAGKILIIDFADGGSLLFHLKLTGQLVFNAKPSRYTRKVFNFDDGSRLVFNDMRKFGWFKFVKKADEQKEIKVLGPEPLTVTLQEFKKLFSKKPNTKIKPLLMNQKFIAGIGNIYADEILFDAKIKPIRKASTLTRKELGSLHRSLKKVLRTAIKAHGSSVQHYLDALGKKGQYVKYHKVYRKTGQKCPRCGAIIKRIKLGGRSAHFCPVCQK